MKNSIFSFFLIAVLPCVVLNAAHAPKPSDAKSLGKQLMNNLCGIFSLDEEYKEQFGERSALAIRNGDWIICSHPPTLVESFTNRTQAIATFFVKMNDEFIRLMTTEENEEAGSILDHTSPAYKHLLGELRYTGKVVLSGKQYMADYDVFRDRQGRVLGAYLVAIPL